jgi:hypothetical protein
MIACSMPRRIVRVFVKTAEAGTAQLQLFGIADTGWTESGIKWSNRPAISGTAIASTNVSSSAGVWLTFDVTAYVKARRAAGASRAVFAFRSGIAARPLMLITSDEATGNRPELKWTES